MSKAVPIYLLDPDHDSFPPAREAQRDGLLAVGGDLSPSRLLKAYASGIFPWYNEGLPILWHSPDPRYVLQPDRIHVSKSLQKTIRRGIFEVRYDTAFEAVIDGCAFAPGPGRESTWITAEMRKAYCELHRLGYAHSVESWADGALRGGLYGLSLGSIFFGESMFALASDASKVAFAHLAKRLVEWKFLLIDCQVPTAHLERFGATSWPRERYLATLAKALRAPTRKGSWMQEGRQMVNDA